MNQAEPPPPPSPPSPPSPPTRRPLRPGTAHSILSAADMAVIGTDTHGRIVECTPAAGALFGYRIEELTGQPVHMLLPPGLRERHVDQLARFVSGPDTERRMNERGTLSGYRKDGTVFPLEVSIARVRHRESWLLVATIRDISDRRGAEQELLWRATHDPLTRLPNRALILDRMTQALNRSIRQGNTVAALFIDLDGFKPVNDLYGHEAGDCVLVEVARRLVGQVRPGDTVARLAGDEFLILSEQTDQPQALGSLAERLIDGLRQPISHHGQALSITASIGIAIGHGATHTVEDLLHHADAAMYAAKERGRDGWQFFNETLQDEARRRLAIRQGLREAIERGEFTALFQPVVETDSGRIRSAELLLRWHPAEGEIPPSLFIPIAESSGTIDAIGLWVFRRGCEAEASWRRRWGTEAPTVSINVSARQLAAEGVVESFTTILDETGADPTRLVLEITETALMADIQTSLRALRRLAELGLRLSVDDFGTGYSSLAQLTRLPVRSLKIDRVFIEGLEDHPESRVVTRAIIGLGRALGLSLVAEGVETEAQRRALLAHGCDLIQGFLIHRPLPEEELCALIEAQSTPARDSADEPVHFLIYVSRAAKSLTRDDLALILHQSRSCNALVGITGFLIHQDGQFLQMLEGDPSRIRALMERISRDPRHTDLDVVIEGQRPTRLFSDWSMGFQDMDSLPGQPDFSAWRRRTIGLLDLAQDARACWRLISSFADLGSTETAGSSSPNPFGPPRTVP